MKEKQIEDIKSYYNIDDKIFDKIRNDFGDVFINGLLFYFEEDGTKSFFNIINNSEKYELIKKWVQFLTAKNILSISNIPDIIIVFNNHEKLIKEIIDNPNLDIETLNNLMLIINQKCEFFKAIETINDLKNIRAVFKKYIEKEQIRNADFYGLIHLKNDIKAILFWGLPQKDVITLNLGDKIPLELEALYLIENEIDAETDINNLWKRFKDIINIAPLITYNEILKLEEEAYASIWNNELYHPDPQTAKYTDENIEVYTLDGQPFKLLTHTISLYGGANYANKKLNIAKNPEIWNTSYGSTYISSSLISNTHMQIFASRPDNVYFGFNHIIPNELLKTKSCDARTTHKIGKKISKEKIETPDHVIANTNFGYTEIVLNRMVNNQRITPDFIICYDGIIDDNSKQAAKYFNIPIYMINRQKYEKINHEKAQKYSSGNLEAINKNTIKELLLSGIEIYKEYSTTPLDKLIKTLDILENSYKSKIIDQNQYDEFFAYVVYLLKKNNNMWANGYNLQYFLNIIHNVIINKNVQMDNDEFKIFCDKMKYFVADELKAYILFKGCENNLFDNDTALSMMQNYYTNEFNDHSKQRINMYIENLNNIREKNIK